MRNDSHARRPANDADHHDAFHGASFAARHTIAAMSETITLEGWRGLARRRQGREPEGTSPCTHVDPLRTVRGLSQSIDVPVGAIVHYVLAMGERRCSACWSWGRLMSRRLLAVCTDAEAGRNRRSRLCRLRPAAPDDLVAQLSAGSPRRLRLTTYRRCSARHAGWRRMRC